MTVHKQMARGLGIAQKVLPECQHFLDMLHLRRLETGRFLDDIVELQLKPGVLAIAAKCLRLRLVRIENGKNMADLPVRVPGKLFEPANGYREWGIGWRLGGPRSFGLIQCVAALIPQILALGIPALHHIANMRSRQSGGHHQKR